MTLLITVFAAIISTILWYNHGTKSRMQLGALALMYWGAAIMWFVDAIFEYAELKAEYFSPAIEDMVNDMFLGLSVVALGLIIWLVIVMVKDPKGTVRATILKKG